MSSNFTIDSTKLNPKFDGYKLDPFNEEKLFRSSLLNVGIQIDQPRHDHRLGFRELQARVRYSQLINGYPLDNHRGSAFCIDKDYNLHMIVFDKLIKQTLFFLLTPLVKPLGNGPALTEPEIHVPIDPQLPSAVAVSRELIVASNGEGDIELIGIEEKNGVMLGASLSAVCYMGAGNEGVQPVPCVLLTARQIKQKIIMVVYSRATSFTEFHIATLSLEIPNETTERLEDGSFVLELKTLHLQKGTEVPMYCAITASGKVIFGSETRYNKVREEDEEEEKKEVPTYCWSQEGADITVQFNVPPNTLKSSISCQFVVDYLSLLVKDTTICYPYRKLWSTIRPESCVWTLEDDTLTLFMTKTDEHTRWPQLFDHDDGVLETLAPDALVEIKNRMDKFTSDQVSSFAQHPAATDKDEDIDEGGQPMMMSVYDAAGNVLEEIVSGNLSWLGKSFDVPHQLPSMCLQMDVDGLVFALREQDDRVQLEHVCTMDAFGFIHASKRDARFTAFDPYLRFASIIESNRNAYIYYHHHDKRVVESQTLIDLTKGHDVSIIGAQLILEDTLLILTELETIVICL